tara:strand:+ start:408 stop:857 length:450 start_codon:yes stop_codon:yes gene_type:complete
MPRCRLCGQVKNIKLFYVNNTHRKTPTVDACRKCKNQQLTDRFSKTAESFIRRRLSKVRKNKEVKVDINYLVKLFVKQKGLCALTKRKMTHILGNNRKCNTNISIDRINSNKGYLKNNIQLVCSDVNIAKSDLKQKDFIKLCRLISKNN